MRLPNGYGSVHKLSGRRRRPFAVRITTGWTDDGRQIVKYLGYYATRQEALTALSDYNKNPYDVDAAKTSFADLWERWTKLTYTDLGQPIPNPYIAAYKRLSNLHDMQFTDIRRRHMQSEIDRCPLGYSTKRMMKTLCNKLFKLAIDYELVSTNFATNIDLPVKEHSRKHKPFTPEELAVLWQHTDDFAAGVVLILCYTGLRPTELLKIRCEDVFFDDRYMMGGMKTAAGRNRCIPIAEKIAPIIKARLDDGGEYLIMDPRDHKPVASYDRLRGRIWEPSKVLKLLDQEHLPHDGRHTCASMLDDAEVNIKTAQLILGHRSQDVTRQVYTHKTRQQLIDAINQI